MRQLANRDRCVIRHGRSARSARNSVLVAAVGSLVCIGVGHAQTWNGTTTGAWNTPGNWVPAGVPASGVTTALGFNSSGAASYTASNDIPGTFTLNAINFNNIGSGLISLDGNSLLFAGASPAINQSGSGPATIANSVQITGAANTDVLTYGGIGAGTTTLTGALSSSPAATATAGGALYVNNPNSTLAISGGGTLYSMRVNQGTLAVTGGVWNLLSTQRQNDTLTGFNDGRWSLNVGETVGQLAGFTQSGGTLTGQMGFFAVADNSVAVGTFSNGAVANFDNSNGRFGINAGSGTINIVSGAHVSARLAELGRQSIAGAGVHAFVNVDGAGSRFDISQQLVLPRGTGTGTLSITNGGVVSVNGNSFTAGDAAGPAGIFVGPSSTFNSVATLITSGGGGTPAGATNININGGTLSAGDLTLGQDGGPDGNVTVNLSGSGGKLLASTGRAVLAGGAGGTTTVNVGGGTTFGVATAIVMSGGFITGTGDPVDGGESLLNVAAGGTVTAGSGILLATGSANGTAGTARLVAVGPGTTINSGTSDIAVAADIFATGAASFSSGVSVVSARGLFVATNPLSSGSVTFEGAGTTATFAATIVGSGGGTDVNGGDSTILVRNGASLTGQNGLLGSGTFGTARLTADGAGTQFTITDGVGTSLFDVGTAVSSAGTFTVSNSAVANISGAGAQLVVGDEGAGSLIVNTGGSLSVGQSAFVATSLGGSGSVFVDGAGSAVAIGGTLVASGGGTSTTGDPLPGGTAAVNVTGGGHLTAQNASIAQNPSALATLTVSGLNSLVTVDAGTGTSELVVANEATAVGSLTVLAGGKVNVLGNTFLSPQVGAISTTTINGGSFTSSAEIQVGLNGAADGGAATFTVSNSGVGSFTGIVGAGTQGVINVNTNAKLFTSAMFTDIGSTVNVDTGGTIKITANGGTLGTSNVSALNIGAGTFDVSDNDLIVNTTPTATIIAHIKNARNGGAWNQTGITSSAARDNPAHNTTLGVLTGAEFQALNGGTATFDGQTISASDTLVKYTYYGDTDFNGVVGFDDYTRIDQGFNLGLTGWLNGDFDFSGSVGFDDYSLIDLAFNTQSGTLARAVDFLEAGQLASMNGAAALAVVRRRFDEFGLAYAESFLRHVKEEMLDVEAGNRVATSVPEPVGFGLMGLTAGLLLARRRVGQ